jgi:hypothetical protein
LDVGEAAVGVDGQLVTGHALGDVPSAHPVLLGRNEFGLHGAGGVAAVAVSVLAPPLHRIAACHRAQMGRRGAGYASPTPPVLHVTRRRAARER